ncbi:acyl carrier protein [Obba rivulosa]|uniref:Acyl carrier protein n=1 Tax=Obba rivulosa TaxID=1052685 RepID=A0A8E2DUE4_9APHY|nr:acyl carrier protein [Obba rivulosa]
MSFLRLAVRSVARPRVAPRLAATFPHARPGFLQVAGYAAAAGLSKEQIATRVLDVLKGFEKVDPAKLTPSASFTDDLGLDSLDAVEVVMAVEEFSVEIPDAEADEIKTVQQAIDYIAKTPDAH